MYLGTEDWIFLWGISLPSWNTKCGLVHTWKLHVRRHNLYSSSPVPTFVVLCSCKPEQFGHQAWRITEPSILHCQTAVQTVDGFLAIYQARHRGCQSRWLCLYALFYSEGHRGGCCISSRVVDSPLGSCKVSCTSCFSQRTDFCGNLSLHRGISTCRVSDRVFSRITVQTFFCGLSADSHVFLDIEKMGKDSIIPSGCRGVGRPSGGGGGGVGRPYAIRWAIASRLELTTERAEKSHPPWLRALECFWVT